MTTVVSYTAEQWQAAFERADNRALEWQERAERAEVALRDVIGWGESHNAQGLIGLAQNGLTDVVDALSRADEFVAANEKRQREDAETLRPGQCPDCGAYRMDGAPPRVHEPQCPLKATP